MSDDNDKLRSGLQRLKETIKKNKGNGYWNYSPYMHGLTNGMIYSESCLENTDPVFLLQPDVWLKHDYSQVLANENLYGVEENWTKDMPDRRNSRDIDRRVCPESDRRENNGGIGDRRKNTSDRRINESKLQD